MTTGGRTAKPKMLETDLYPPVKAWLEKQGYVVHAEVGACDVAARRGDELVLIELKLAVNLDLLLQLVRRQECSASVYAAVPAPKAMNDKRWRGLTRLLKRLEVGLIVIFMDSPVRRVELLFHPISQSRRIRKAGTRALLREMDGRRSDLNLGGSTRRKIMTAYREQALLTAGLLAGFKEATPKELRVAGASDKAGAILRDNHYGWFERVARGLYCLSEAGREALNDYREYLSGGS